MGFRALRTPVVKKILGLHLSKFVCFFCREYDMVFIPALQCVAASKTDGMLGGGLSRSAQSRSERNLMAAVEADDKVQ